MKISILLPYKENFTHEAAGAVSLFVHQIWNVSKYKKKITIFGNTNYKKYLNKNYKNIKYSDNTKKICNKLKNKVLEYFFIQK